MANHWQDQQQQGGAYPPSASATNPRHHNNNNMNPYHPQQLPPQPQQQQQQPAYSTSYPVYPPASGRQSWGSSPGYNGPSPASRSSGPNPGGYEGHSPMNAGSSIRVPGGGGGHLSPYGHQPPLYQSQLHPSEQQQQHGPRSGTAHSPYDYPAGNNNNYPPSQHGNWNTAPLPSVLQHNQNPMDMHTHRPPMMSEGSMGRGMTAVKPDDDDDEDDYDGKGKGRGGDANAAAKGTSDFVKKLFSMLDDKAYDNIVGWSPNGESFLVKDMTGFTKHVLPRNFRHSNFASFVRQLNKYDFHKVKNPEDGPASNGELVWEFQHPDFVRGRDDLLENVKRKAPTKKKGPIKGGSALEERDETPSMVSHTGDLAAATATADKNGESYAQLKSQVLYLTSVQEQMQNHINDLAKQYQGVVGEMLTFQRNMAQQDQLMQNLIQYLMNLEQDQQNAEPRTSVTNLLGAAAEESPFARSTAASKLVESYEDAAQASFAHLNELSRRGKATGQSSSSEATTGTSVSHIGGGTTTASSVAPVSPKSAASPIDPKFASAAADGEEPSKRYLTNIATEKSSTKSSPGEALNSNNNFTRTKDGSTESSATKANVKAENNSGAAKSNFSIARARRPTVVPGWAVPPRVLLVDDDEVCRRLSSKFLQVFGCSIDYAVDGMSAVNKMNQEKYDLVLMDILMPNLDGMSATELIRQFDPNTPIISMTSNSGPSELINYMRSGMNDCLSKPFTRDGLLNMLDKHLIHLKAVQKKEDAPKLTGRGSITEGDMSLLTNQLFANAENVDYGSTGAEGTLNPLAGMGFTDEEYVAMLQNLIASGSVHDDAPTEQLPESAVNSANGHKRAAPEDASATSNQHSSEQDSKRGRFDSAT